jgi:hypothetical protein
MKKIYVTLAFVWVAAGFCSAQMSKQYFDGVDTSFWKSILIDKVPGSSNIWQVGKPQKVIFDTAATQPNAIVTDLKNAYPRNNRSSFIAKIRLPYSHGIFVLQWMQKLDMHPDHDGGIIEYTKDKGKTWINVFNNPYVQRFYGYDPANADTLQGGEYAFSGTDSTWRNVWLCFSYSWMSIFTNNDTALFRFTFSSDAVGLNNNKEGWMLDNMISHLTHIHTIRQEAQENYLTVFPNPANNIVHIEAAEQMAFHIIERMELIDATGRTVEEWEDIPTKFWIDTRKYTSGLYFLRIKTNFKSEVRRLVICKE